MNVAVLDTVGFIAFALVPAVCVAVMMLDGRFSDGRGYARFGAFMLWLGLGGICFFIYFMSPVPRMFDNDYGILGSPGFQFYSMSSLVGVLIGGLVMTYEDLRPLWSNEEEDARAPEPRQQ